MSEILVCDWGTSSFRLMRLGFDGRVVGEVTSSSGIKTLDRAEIEPYLLTQCRSLDPEGQLAVILCGMVGSGIGWYEVPYVACPASAGSLARSMCEIPAQKLNAYCVPGVKKLAASGEADVMRGEETQVIGWQSQASSEELAGSLLCLPGTHSKWVTVRDGEIQDLNTAFTGELYAVLKDHSVLVQGEQESSVEAFQAGLESSRAESGLIHQVFNARSRAVLGVHKPEHNAAYLSGLLLGCEVGAMAHQLQGVEANGLVHLICGEHLADPYRRAMAFYDLECRHYSGDVFSAQGLRVIAAAYGLI